MTTSSSGVSETMTTISVANERFRHTKVMHAPPLGAVLASYLIDHKINGKFLLAEAPPTKIPMEIDRLTVLDKSAGVLGQITALRPGYPPDKDSRSGPARSQSVPSMHTGNLRPIHSGPALLLRMGGASDGLHVRTSRDDLLRWIMSASVPETATIIAPEAVVRPGSEAAPGGVWAADTCRESAAEVAKLVKAVASGCRFEESVQHNKFTAPVAMILFPYMFMDIDIYDEMLKASKLLEANDVTSFKVETYADGSASKPLSIDVYKLVGPLSLFPGTMLVDAYFPCPLNNKIWLRHVDLVDRLAGDQDWSLNLLARTALLPSISKSAQLLEEWYKGFIEATKYIPSIVLSDWFVNLQGILFALKSGKASDCGVSAEEAERTLFKYLQEYDVPDGAIRALLSFYDMVASRFVKNCHERVATSFSALWSYIHPFGHNDKVSHSFYHFPRRSTEPTEMQYLIRQSYCDVLSPILDMAAQRGFVLGFDDDYKYSLEEVDV